MQTVSREWKDNQKEVLVSESFVELSLKLTDPDAYEDASAEHNGSAYFSDDADYVVSEVDKNVDPHATLEKNLWVLDGSREILPASDYGENGYIGDVICGASRTFTKNPIVSVNFSKVFTDLITGVSIVWSNVFGEYATDFIITAYNDNQVVATETVTGNTEVNLTVYVDIVNYNKITVEVLKWSIPHRRARITAIQIGTELIYTKNDIMSYSHSQDVDLISASLPKSEISFSIDNVDNSFNPNNNESLAKYLMERQEVKVKYGYKLDDKVEWIDSGTFYISEWDAPQNGLEANFTARDLLEFMTGTFYKGVFTTGTGRTLYSLAEEVLLDANLPLDETGSVKWVIDESLKNIYTTAPLPVDTHANCLQLIANAGSCAIWQDRKGILHIERIVTNTQGSTETYEFENTYWVDVPISENARYEISCTTEISDVEIFDANNIRIDNFPMLFKKVVNIDLTKYSEKIVKIIVSTPDYATGSVTVTNTTPEYSITLFNSYSPSEITLSKPLKQVDIMCYSYSQESERMELYNDTVTIGGTVDVIVNYSNTAYGVFANVSGGTLNSAKYYANACVLNITATGDVSIIVNGFSRTPSSTIVTVESGTSGETITIDNPLITNRVYAKQVGEWVEGYMKNRKILSSQWRADPRLDALDVVVNENKYNTNNVIMTSVGYTYNGVFKGSGEGRVI